jgi:hypothetical protein
MGEARLGKATSATPSNAVRFLAHENDDPLLLKQEALRQPDQLLQRAVTGSQSKARGIRSGDEEEGDRAAILGALGENPASPSFEMACIELGDSAKPKLKKQRQNSKQPPRPWLRPKLLDGDPRRPRCLGLEKKRPLVSKGSLSARRGTRTPMALNR